MKKILIVEDDHLQAFVQRKFLEKNGHTLCIANSGTEAIEHAKNEHFDLVIMDMRIKGELDGIDTMLEIQKFSKAPVIYSTGNSENSIRERATKTNVKTFLIKPINLDELEKLINEI